MNANRYKSVLYIILGSICLLLGALGLILPLLPTTPFWLLTAYLYMHGSEKLYQRAMNNKMFGNTIRHFYQYKAIPLHAKISSITILWTTILFSIWLVGQLWITIVLLLISVGVTIHILSYKTYRKNVDK